MDRRSFLAGVGGLGTVTAAGCSGSAGDGEDGTVSAIEGWLVPPPEEYRLGSDYNLSYVSPSGLASATDAVSERTVRDHRWRILYDALGLSPENVAHRFTVTVPSRWGIRYTVILGGFGRDDVIDAVLEQGGTEVGSHGEYRYVRPVASSHVFAVADGRLVATPFGSEHERRLEVVIETGAGDRERLLDRTTSTYIAVRRILRELPPGLVISLDRGGLGGDPGEAEFYDLVASGAAGWVDGDTAVDLEFFVFPDADDVHEPSIETYLDSLREDGWVEAEFSVDGSLVEVRTSAPAADVPDDWGSTGR